MNKKEKEELIDDIRKTFTSLSILVPFAYPLIAWPIVFREDPTFLAATNGVSFIVNPDRWKELSFEEKIFLSLHEWLHVALMHPKRQRTRRHKTFNFAADFTINAMIKNDFNFKMPCGLYEPYYYRGKSTEDIYKDLDSEILERENKGYIPYCSICNRIFHRGDRLAEPDEQHCPICYRPCQEKIVPPPYIDRELAINLLMNGLFNLPWGDDLIDMPDGCDEDAIIDQVLKAAARHNQMKPGKLPGALTEHVEQLKQPNVPWERLFFRFSKETLKGKTDRNPYRPESKYLPFDILVPKEVQVGIAKVVLILDTSASMYSEEFEYALGAVEKLGSLASHITLITTDTEVQDVFRVRNLRHELKTRKVVIRGRGGTNMTAAFELADRLHPNLIILYSDMELDFPPKPKTPVIFLSCGSQNKAPYGLWLDISRKKESA